jgi:putative phosphoesterase
MTMRLAVISDTHLSGPNPWFESIFEQYLAGADLLLHCGDATSVSLWSYLLQHPRFYAVAGNTDAHDLAETLPRKLELRLFGQRVAMVHGWGPRPGLSQRLAQAFEGLYDCIFFGHSHTAEDIVHGATRLINPGSLRPGGSLALVDCTESGLSVRHVEV